MAQAIEERVKTIICDQLGVASNEVNPDSKLIEDLGADSLGIVELIMVMEEEFECEIPDEEAEKIRTVSDVVSYIKNNS